MSCCLVVVVDERTSFMDRSRLVIGFDNTGVKRTFLIYPTRVSGYLVVYLYPFSSVSPECSDLIPPRTETEVRETEVLDGIRFDDIM